MDFLKNCLVLGANGFIGSHLVDALAEKNHFIRAFDTFHSDPQFFLKKNIEIYQANLFDNNRIMAALKDIDFVFLCVSASNPHNSDQDPLSCIDQDLKWSVYFFEQCIKACVKKVIFLSSAGTVYGHIAEVKSASEEDATLPRSPYGICKLATENYLHYFHQKFGLNNITYRLANPYGPRQKLRNQHGVIPAFLQKIKAEQALEILGDGSSSRDYIYIGDLIRMIMASFDQKTRFDIYNLGNGIQTNLNEIAHLLKKLTHSNVPLFYKDAPKTFLNKTQISIDRFVNEFDIRPSISIEQGLINTIQANL